MKPLVEKRGMKKKKQMRMKILFIKLKFLLTGTLNIYMDST